MWSRVANRVGEDLDEGMVAYLTQSALGFPDVSLRADGNMVVPETAVYQNQLASMLSLAVGQKEHFATLFRAYHGQIDDVPMLAAAIDSFYGRFAALQR